LASPRTLYAEPASEMVARFVGRGMVVPALVIGRNAERVVVDIFGTRLPVRGMGQSGERRSLCLRAENLAIAPNGSGIRGRVTGFAFHGNATLLTVQPDAADAPELKVEHAGPSPEAGSAVTVEVRDGWIIPQQSTLATDLDSGR
jgi:iron(III) transport system ATP-binding protein